MFWKMTTISRQNRKYVEAADAGTEIEVVEQPAWHAISHASVCRICGPCRSRPAGQCSKTLGLIKRLPKIFSFKLFFLLHEHGLNL